MKIGEIKIGMKLTVVSLPEIEDAHYRQLQSDALNCEVRVIRVYKYGERNILCEYGKFHEYIYLKPENLEAISELLEERKVEKG